MKLPKLKKDDLIIIHGWDWISLESWTSRSEAEKLDCPKFKSSGFYLNHGKDKNGTEILRWYSHSITYNGSEDVRGVQTMPLSAIEEVVKR